MGIDLKTRRKDILEKLSSGQVLVHRPSWPHKLSEYNTLEADGGANGSKSYTEVSKTDYKWLFGNGYVKQSNYEWGGKVTYTITDAGKRRLEEM